ncbi:MAG: hypothetical protein R2807_00085 [Chitinophagales bacterium]
MKATATKAKAEVKQKVAPAKKAATPAPKATTPAKKAATTKKEGYLQRKYDQKIKRLSSFFLRNFGFYLVRNQGSSIKTNLFHFYNN